MRVLNTSAGQDLAGIGYRYMVAAQRASIEYRTAHRTQTYLNYPYDILWGSDEEQLVKDLYRAADVMHLNNSFDPYVKLHGPAAMKPAIIEQHGTQFRGYPSAPIREAVSRHILQGVSTIDLQRSAPDLLHWLPSPYDLPSLAKTGADNRRESDGLIRIAHAPTARGIKSTDQLIQAVAELKAEGLPLYLDVIEGTSWAECLKRKAKADIFFDQVRLGYGCNAIEAWGMGIPVIAGADEWTIDRMWRTFDRAMPFYTATVGTIKESVRYLAQSADARAQWGAVGLHHAEKYHAEEPALAYALDLYEQAIKEMAGVVRRRTISVTGAEQGDRGRGVFRSPKYIGLMIVHRDSKFKFEAGKLATDDPYAQELIREFIGIHPEFGVEEDLAAAPDTADTLVGKGHGGPRTSADKISTDAAGGTLLAGGTP